MKTVNKLIEYYNRNKKIDRYGTNVSGEYYIYLYCVLEKINQHPGGEDVVTYNIESVLEEIYSKPIKINSFEEFVDICKKQVIYLSDFGDKDDYVASLYPINIDISGISFTFNGFSIIFKKHSNLDSYWFSNEVEDIDQQFNGQRMLLDTEYSSYGEVSFRTNDFRSFLADHQSLMDALMGILYSRLNLHTLKYHESKEATVSYGELFYEINPFLISFRKNNNYLNGSKKSIDYPATLNLADINDLVKILESLDLSKYIDRLVFDSLQLYYKAEISQVKYNKFMSYWQLCENIVLSDEFGGDTTKMLNRSELVTSFFTNQFIEQKPIIRKLSKIRNAYVHRGDTNFSEHYSDILGSLANSVLNWLLANRLLFSSKNELSQYYKLLSSSKKDLLSNIKITKIVMDQR